MRSVVRFHFPFEVLFRPTGTGRIMREIKLLGVGGVVYGISTLFEAHAHPRNQPPARCREKG
jgi:hypothetical protein